MKNRNIRYLTHEGIKNIGINRLMTVASVAVLLSCLVIIGSAVMLFLNVDSLLENIESQNVVMAFCEVGASQEDIDSTAEQLRAIENISQCDFVSKADAYETVKSSLGEDASILNNIDDTFLPDGFRIVVDDMSLFDETVNKIKVISTISSIQQNGDLAQKFQEIRTSVTYISIGLISILFVVSMFIIANTVRITMFSRKLEISIMKAVGATNWFIRWPFIVEGVFIGLVSAILAFGILAGLYYILSDSLTTIFGILGNTIVNFWDYAGLIFLSFTLVGVVTGCLGSIISIRKYLKEQGSVVLNEN